MASKIKPIVKLSEINGNAYVIIGACMRAAKYAGWTDEEIEIWKIEAMSGDYDHLLQTAMKYFEVE